MSEDVLYTVAEVAEKLNIHPVTIRNWIRQGAIAASKIGKEYRISEEQLQKFFAAGTKDKSNPATSKGPGAEDRRRSQRIRPVPVRMDTSINFAIRRHLQYLQADDPDQEQKCRELLEHPPFHTESDNEYVEWVIDKLYNKIHTEKSSIAAMLGCSFPGLSLQVYSKLQYGIHLICQDVISGDYFVFETQLTDMDSGFVDRLISKIEWLSQVTGIENKGIQGIVLIRNRYFEDFLKDGLSDLLQRSGRDIRSIEIDLQFIKYIE